MSKITDAFKNKKCFIPFITCGDPDLETTKEIILAMQEAGADIIELGIPFSDPTAEGPVIQDANIRSLSSGTTTTKILDMVKEIRGQVHVPLVFMTYANVIFSRGIENFADASKEAGIDGIILADVSFEEKEEFAPAFRERGIDYISLIAPTSEARIGAIAKAAEGFVYCVSSLGVTGVRTTITTDIGAMISQVRSANPDIPCAVGFGISSAEQAKSMCCFADGAIVGSAIVKIVARYGKDAPKHVAKFVREMKDAISC